LLSLLFGRRGGRGGLPLRLHLCKHRANRSAPDLRVLRRNGLLAIEPTAGKRTVRSPHCSQSSSCAYTG